MTNDTAVEMFVGGVLMDPATQAPIVVLKDETGQMTLPIWIGLAEATSIASAIKQVTMARPLTHDLLYDILLEMSVSVQRIVITDLKESTYYAELVLSQGDRVMVVDCRPSDAIAIALRASAPIYVVQRVLDQAKAAFASQVQTPAGDTPEGSEDKPDEPQDPTKDFTAIDKDKWKEILSQLDPDDFKYKM